MIELKKKSHFGGPDYEVWIDVLVLKKHVSHVYDSYAKF